MMHPAPIPVDENSDIEPADIDVTAFVRSHLGVQLQSYFDLPSHDVLPETLAHLVDRFRNASALFGERNSEEFKNSLIKAIPSLRTFAFSISGDLVRSDDLVQETLVKAWTNQHRFTIGTNLIAWLFTIMRNQFYSEIRKHKREVEDADGMMAAQMTAPAAQEHCVDLRTLHSHLSKLPATQSEALMLVAAQGMTYEAAAEVLGCQVGTVKSRVSRARAVLAGRFGMGLEQSSA